jgi:hypothetical protein
MTTPYYILDADGRTPIAVDDVMIWSRWYHTANRVVAHTPISGGMVSTVFLGLDHGFTISRPPLLWETMVFPNGSWLDEFCQRYASYDDAVEGHAAIVARWSE